MCRSSPAAHGLRFEREVAGGPFPCWLCFQQPAGLACGGNENSGTGETAGTQVGERTVGVRQRVRLDMRAQRDLGGEREELTGVLACQIGDRADRPFFPQEPIWKRRYVAHVDAGAHDHASRPYMRQRLGHSGPTGAKMIALSSGAAAGSFENPAHDGSDISRKLQGLVVAWGPKAKTSRPWCTATWR